MRRPKGDGIEGPSSTDSSLHHHFWTLLASSRTIWFDILKAITLCTLFLLAQNWWTQFAKSKFCHANLACSRCSSIFHPNNERIFYLAKIGVIIQERFAILVVWRCLLHTLLYVRPKGQLIKLFPFYSPNVIVYLMID